MGMLSDCCSGDLRGVGSILPVLVGQVRVTHLATGHWSLATSHEPRAISVVPLTLSARLQQLREVTNHQTNPT